MMVARSISLSEFDYDPERTEFLSQKTELGSICNTVAAFLNTSGGHVFIGATPTNIYGIENAEEYAEEIRRNLLLEIVPLGVWEVEILTLENKSIVAITVIEGREKPYVANRTIWLRNNNSTQRALGPAVASMIGQRVEDDTRWERRFIAAANFEDLDISLVNEIAEYAFRIGRWNGKRGEPLSFLSSLGLMFEGQLTNAAVTLFGKNPERFLPQIRVRVTGMPTGKAGRAYSFDRYFEGSLLNIANELPGFLEDRLRDIVSEFSDDEWKRKDSVARYPTLAIREGVMNALVHRDYAFNSNVQIILRSDSLEISSPGNLPFELKIDDLKRNHLSLPRNPDIAHVAFLAGLIEKVGRGTQLIIEASAEADLIPPTWHTTPTSTTLTLYAKRRDFSETPRSSETGKLNSKLSELLSVFKYNNIEDISVANLSNLLNGADVRLLRYHLEKLVELGYIVKHGTRRNYTYGLTEKVKQ